MLNKSQAAAHVWSVLCSSSVIDQSSNNLTLFNTLERVTITIPKSEAEKIKKQISTQGAKGFLFPIPFELVNLFHKTEAQKAAAFDVRIRLLAPSGEEIQLVTERKIAIEKDKRNFRLRSQFTNFPVSSEGEYTFLVEMRDVDSSNYVEVASVPLEIFIKENTVSPKNKQG